MISQEPNGQMVLVEADDSVIAGNIEGPLDLISDIKWKIAKEIGMLRNTFELRIPGGKVENAEEVLWKAGVSNYSLFVVFEENEPMINESKSRSVRSCVGISGSVGEMSGSVS
jgi:hypothetical protein